MEDCLNDMLVLQVDECFNWIFLFLISMKCNQQEKSFLYSTLFLVFTLFVWIYFDLKKINTFCTLQQQIQTHRFERPINYYKLEVD